MTFNDSESKHIMQGIRKSLKTLIDYDMFYFKGRWVEWFFEMWLVDSKLKQKWSNKSNLRRLHMPIGHLWQMSSVLPQSQNLGPDS